MKLLASAASAVIVTVAFMPNVALAADSAQFSVTVTGHVDPRCNWLTGGEDVNLTIGNFVDNDARVREQAALIDAPDIA